MAEDETTFLCGFSSGRQRRYGTTSYVTAKPSYSDIVHHSVIPDDTIQGLALRYGSSVTEIKRINKLWSNDSIHLKETLLIPVLAEFSIPTSSSRSKDLSNGVPGTSSRVNYCRGQSASQVSSPVNPSKSRRFSQESSVRNSRTGSVTFGASCSSENDKSESSVSELLSRIDQSIKSTTKNVQKLEKESTIDKVLDQADSGFSASSSGYSFQNLSLRTRSPSPTEVRTEGKRTDIPLQKLRQAQDKFYQL